MKRNITYTCLILLLFSCIERKVPAYETLDVTSEIYPDYADCIIPPNIAPLNFRLTKEYPDARLVISVHQQKWEIKAAKKQFTFPTSLWKKMLNMAKGDSIRLQVVIKENNAWKGFAPFALHVATEEVDPYLAYRLIEPGYQTWDKMGIYQRNLSNYKETPIIENRLTQDNCMNCHSFPMQNPDKMLFHMRAGLAGTFLIDGKAIEKLNTKTDQTIGPLVYPSWHPSGRFIAFSVNDTQQVFHMNDANRIEVYDAKSDVVVYDIEKKEIITSGLLYSDSSLETHPTFSPDGKTLYFCSAETGDYSTNFKDIKYSLCSVSFDAQERSFGTVADTLYKASSEGRSVSFPRVSPDGKYLLYTLSDYGTFSIWHKDADLYMINLPENSHYPLTAANSNEVESYHSWSSNSRWIVFSSRRNDGLYTRPYFAYINKEGIAGKPFLLPQKDTFFYDWFMKSYNIPEFITGPVKDYRRQIIQESMKEGINISFSSAK